MHVSPHVLTAIFPDEPGLAGTRMSTLWILLALDEGGGNNQSYKTCKAPDKSSQPNKKHPSCHSTNSVRALKGTYLHVYLHSLLLEVINASKRIFACIYWQKTENVFLL